MSKKPCFRGPFDGKDGKRVETLLQSEQQQLYHIYWSLWRWLSRNKSILVISKILRLFLNKLTGDDKYSLINEDILTQPIQMKLSQK